MQTPTPTIPYPLSRPTRLAVMLSLIAIFFITSPLVLLYARGFTFDWQEKKIVHGGALSIETDPKEVNVFINNIKLNSDLPARFSHVIPGNYHVKIEQTGYIPWERDITILSNQTLYLHGIDLVQPGSSSSLAFSRRNIEALFPSHRNEWFVFFTKEDKAFEIFLFEPKNRKTTLLTRVLSEIQPKLIWSPKDTFIFIESQLENTTHWLIVSPHNPTEIKTLSFPSKTQTQFQWEPNTTGSDFFFQEGNRIKRASAQSSEPFFTLPTSTAVWFASSEQLSQWSNHSLTQINQNDQTLFSVPTEHTLTKILHVNENRLVAKNNNTLLLYHRQGENWTEAVIPAKHFYFSPDSEEFWIWNEGELTLLSAAGELKLINRFTQDIVSVQPLTSSPTLLIATQNSLLAFHPYYYTTHELMRVQLIENVSVDRKRRDIYFLGVQNGERGVWRVGY